MLYVSHDRYFINKTATRILDLTGKRMMNYIGNYDYYLEKHEAMMNAHFGTENVEPTGGIVGFAHQRRERRLKLPEKRRRAARTQAESLTGKPRRKSRPARENVRMT